MLSCNLRRRLLALRPLPTSSRYRSSPNRGFTLSHIAGRLSLHSQPLRHSFGAYLEATCSSLIETSAPDLHIFKQKFFSQPLYIHIHHELERTDGRLHTVREHSGIFSSAQPRALASLGGGSAMILCQGEITLTWPTGTRWSKYIFCRRCIGRLCGCWVPFANSKPRTRESLTMGDKEKTGRLTASEFSFARDTWCFFICSVC